MKKRKNVYNKPRISGISKSVKSSLTNKLKSFCIINRSFCLGFLGGVLMCALANPDRLNFLVCVSDIFKG